MKHIGFKHQRESKQIRDNINVSNFSEIGQFNSFKRQI
jgi:hypothetical protein